MDFQFTPFDPATATANAWQALHILENQGQAEEYPEDPPVTLDFVMRRWRNQPTYVDRRTWLVVAGPEHTPAGRGSVETWNIEENRHAASFSIYVSPAYRRQGLARRLLAEIVPVAQERGRRLLLSWDTDAMPAGAAFLTHLGAQPALVAHFSQLVIADLDRQLLAAWIARARERAGDLELHTWDGPYPEAELLAVARLAEVMNTAPRGDLDIEDEHLTPERLRDWEAQMRARGDERWSLYIRDPVDGGLAGYTQVVWNPGQPTVVWQWETGVVPAYRNRGLGRWLKAAMLDRIVRERPEARFVRTDNAQVNAPMLKINFELGFRPRARWTNWQVATDTVAQYLAGAAAL